MYSFSVSACGDGQFDGKPTSLARCAPNQDLAVVRFDNMFHQAEADPHPLRFPPQLRAEPIKPFKNLFMFLNRDSGPVILNPNRKAGLDSVVFFSGSEYRILNTEYWPQYRL